MTAPQTIDDLGLTGSLYLAALLLAQNKRVRVAPTRRMSVAVMNCLREMELIDVPWPEARWSVQPDAEETPIEGLQWRYRWQAYVRPGLVEALREYLQSIPNDDYGIALRLRFWRELASAEGEQFFEAQLAKHHFEASWAQDLTFVQRDCQVELSAAQWRYCCWAGIRQGATVAQRQRVPDLPAVREAIYSELRRRVGPVASGQWGGALPPFTPVPESALSQLFVVDLTRLGAGFWSLPPADLALLGSQLESQ